MTVELLDGLERVRTTDTFEKDHRPAGLRRAHRVADRVGPASSCTPEPSPSCLRTTRTTGSTSQRERAR